MVVGILLTKKKKAPVGATTRYNPPKQMLDGIVSLEEKLASSDIKIGNVALETDSEPVQQGIKEEPSPSEPAEPAQEALAEEAKPPSSEEA
jgi:hypothetical protein